MKISLLFITSFQKKAGVNLYKLSQPCFALLLLMILCVCKGPVCFSQISGKSKIVLKDKTVLNNVRIWNIHAYKIEYELKESLHDIETMRIARIENDSAIFSFDSLGQLNARPYDWLLKTNGDTVFCIISQLGGNYIYYYPKGRENRSYIPESSVTKYQVYKPEPIRKEVPVKVPLPQKAIEADSSGEVKSDTNKIEGGAIDSAATSQPQAEIEIQKPEIFIPKIEDRPDEKLNETSLSLPTPSDFCYESYLKGEQAAMNKSQSIWAVGTFCTNGCLFGLTASALSLFALNRNDPPLYIPEGVDSKCFLLGYQNQEAKKRMHNTALGGLLSSLVAISAYLAIVISQ